MKILNFVHRGHFGGAQWRVVWIGECLSNYGVDTKIIVPKISDNIFENFLIGRKFPHQIFFIPAIKSAKYFFHNVFYLIYLPISTFQMLKLLQRDAVDMLHINGMTNLAPLFAGLMARKPILWHFNDTITPVWFELLIRCLAKKCFLVAASQAVSDVYCLDNYGYKYLGVLPPPLPPETEIYKISKGSNNLGLDNHEIVLGFVGNIIRTKGVLDFIDVIYKLKQLNYKVKGILVGSNLSGHELFAEEVKRKIVKLGVSEDILCLGYQLDVQRFMRQFDIFIFPSYTEAAPMVVLQALSLGVPVVSTPVGNVPELAEKVMIHQVKIGKIDEYVEKVTNILAENTPDVYVEQSKYIKENYSIANVASQTLKLYKRILFNEF